jgi:CheY-like chemotaxis protein
MMTSSSKRILVVDDNKSLVMVMARILQKEGYDVSTAFDGTEGMEKAQSEKPDIIILDISMPGPDGYAVCRQLRLDPNTSNIPVVFLSSKGNIDEKRGPAGVGLKELQLGYSYGASDFLHKPISSKELITTVKGILSLDNILSSD